MPETELTKQKTATVSKTEPKHHQTIGELLYSKGFQNELKKALPSFMSPEKIARIALTELRSNPRLMQCDSVSLLGCIMKSSQFGLDIDSLKGHAYLVPYKNECQLIVGYKGLLSLAVRSGKLLSIEVQEVREADEFEIEHGDNYGLRHKPGKKSREERGKIIGYYAYAHLLNGGKHFEYMGMDEINEIRNCSKSSNSPSSPWVTFFSEMAKKTVIRRLCKYLSLSTEMDEAIALDELADANIQSKKIRSIGTEILDETPVTFDYEVVSSKTAA